MGNRLGLLQCGRAQPDQVLIGIFHVTGQGRALNRGVDLPDAVDESCDSLFQSPPWNSAIFGEREPVRSGQSVAFADDGQRELIIGYDETRGNQIVRRRQTLNAVRSCQQGKILQVCVSVADPQLKSVRR
jgi:hypothetical protein